jgi:cytochrome c oxidase subunit IV
MAFVRIFDVQDALLEWALAIPLSISLAGIITSVMIYTATWSPALGFVILAGITIVCVIVQALIQLRIIVWPISEISVPIRREKQDK